MTARSSQTAREIAALCLVFLALLVLLSLVTYHASDSNLLTSSASHGPIRNLVGIVGANLAAFLLVGMGIGAYWLPIFLALGALRLLTKRPMSHPALAVLGGILLVFATCGLAALNYPSIRLWGEPLPGSGGMAGLLLKSTLLYYLNLVGAQLTLWMLLAVSLLIVTPFSLAQVGGLSSTTVQRLSQSLQSALRRRKPKAKRRPPAEDHAPPVVKTEPEPKPRPPEVQQEQFTFMTAEGKFRLPDISLLDKMDESVSRPDQESLLMNSRILEKKLADFGVEGKVIEVCPGPVITMYEFEPAPGVKISKIVGLADDLAMALKSPSIRVVAPIPGKGALGIEIPNTSRQPVAVHDVISGLEFAQQKGKLALALGKDTMGKPVVANLARMPHLLIAGATGTGKSVCLNAIIVSLLFRATPEEVRLLLIDPKRIELSSYEGIPHLLHPVVTDAKKANIALKWAVTEMQRRYELLNLKGVRSIDRYNQAVAKTATRRPKPTSAPVEGQEPEDEPLPYLVIIIDELADLMMVASREVEESIIRLAQMARAAGMHLILATQRPSVDVITGIIKANIPARISFQVSSRVDSRTILDATGAEVLLGAGDMLMLPPGTAKLQRIHGAYVSEVEIRKITEFLRKQRKPSYDETVLEYQERAENGEADAEQDEKYDEAVSLVMETRQASISMLQRRLRVGYNRAARMIEMMERQGLVTPTDGTRPREVLPPK